ncbi:hypothetical protein LC087_06840 [Bacillus carboniphilus]|uniref:Uncharacterized protein n=1 Tax=Bacillus carboniphilus TaxID=86663 RepID=A0ABY9JZ44_9BACI|nr:hypothetical protein [Bacillus carboniphilus]WLR43832.1 hypothetical protein LC087_06840 [Bacillus carboniphilus]
MFSGTSTSFANSNQTETENIQNAYYYVDGVEYEIPKEEFSNLLDEDNIVELPVESTVEKEEKINPKDGPLKANACVAGYEFDGSRKSSGFKKASNGSGSRVINKSKNNLTEVSQLSGTTTVSGSVSGSTKVSWGVIKGEVGFNIGGSQSWTKSQSTSITVRPGDWGWIDYGVIAETWKGNYYYLSSSCSKQSSKYITVSGPKYKTKLAKTEKYPY